MVIEFAAVDVNGVLLGSKTTNVLVDSGADITMLNADLATDLGLDLASMTPATVEGVGGDTTVYDPTLPLMASLCGRWVPVPVCFETGRNINLLGREGAIESMFLVFAHQHAMMLAAQG